MFVAQDTDGVGGYIVGAADTLAFETRLEAEWWPDLRAEYADYADTPHAERTPDQRRVHAIRQPRRTPSEIANAYPSHLHINLLPRLRGHGVGRALMDRWLAAVSESGSTGAHLATGAANTRAIRFYTAYGFRALALVPHSVSGAVWLGIALRRDGPG